MDLYQKYMESKKQNLKSKVDVLLEIINEYPKIIDYIYNRVDSCFGEHTVYLIHMRVRGIDMIKTGYTKNTIKGRFSESRYSGIEQLEIIEVLRSNTLQAKAAVEFEKALKKSYKQFFITTELKLPGKSEFMDIQFKENILEKYDILFQEFEKIIGLKSPN